MYYQNYLSTANKFPLYCTKLRLSFIRRDVGLDMYVPSTHNHNGIIFENLKMIVHASIFYEKQTLHKIRILSKYFETEIGTIMYRSIFFN